MLFANGGLLFSDWCWSAMEFAGYKNIFVHLEDQQRLTSIGRSELLVGHDISLNKKMCQFGGGGSPNFKVIKIFGLILVGV